MSFTRSGPNSRCPAHGTHSLRRCPERTQRDAEGREQLRTATLSMLRGIMEPDPAIATDSAASTSLDVGATLGLAPSPKEPKP